MPADGKTTISILSTNRQQILGRKRNMLAYKENKSLYIQKQNV
jgi:hypothetical protein